MVKNQHHIQKVLNLAELQIGGKAIIMLEDGRIAKTSVIEKWSISTITRHGKIETRNSIYIF